MFCLLYTKNGVNLSILFHEIFIFNKKKPVFILLKAQWKKKLAIFTIIFFRRYVNVISGYDDG